MADVRISDLTAAPDAALVDATLLEVSTGSGGASYSLSLARLKTFLAATFARIGYRASGDAANTVLATDRTLATSTAFTAPRTWTLPAANTVPAGTTFRFVDLAAAVSGTNTLTIALAGSDTLNGGTAGLVLSTPRFDFTLTSDGASKWGGQGPLGVERGGTGSSTAAGARATLGAAASGANADITGLSALTSLTCSGKATFGSGIAGPAEMNVQTTSVTGFGGAWGAGMMTIGPNTAASGSGSGALGFGYDAANRVGYIGSISPASSWDRLVIQFGTFQLYTGAGGVSALTVDSSGNVAIQQTLQIANPLAVTSGGTGSTSLSGALDAAFGATQGTLLARGANAWATLGPGTAGQVLTSSGAGASPSFAAPSGAGGGAPSAYNTRALPYTATAADKGTQINVTGSGALSLPAATAVSGWYAYVRKADGSGTGAITPASGTIDGLASINLYQENYIVWYDAVASVFRTAGRPKGWISVQGNTTLTGQSLASLSIQAGFQDSEISETEINLSNLTLSASGQIAMRAIKNGATLANGTYTIESITTATTTVAATSTNGASTATGLVSTASTGPISAVLNARNTVSTIVADQRVDFWGMQIGATRRGTFYEGTAAALQGITFVPSAGNISSITYGVRGYRP